MDKLNEILERYYRGETTVEEERQLRAASRLEELPDDPMPAYQGRKSDMPAGLLDRIQRDIHTRANHRRHNLRITLRITLCSTAAILILIICLRGMLPQPRIDNIRLSDNMKKERFENALRIIGHVLEENTPPVQKVLYEDNKLIIAIE